MLLKRKQQFSFSATLTAIPIPGRVVFSSHLSFLRLTSRNCEDKIKERPVDGSRIISLRSFDAKRASRVTRFCRHEDWWKTCEIFKGTKNRRTAPSKRSRAWKRSISVAVSKFQQEREEIFRTVMLSLRRKPWTRPFLSLRKIVLLVLEGIILTRIWKKNTFVERTFPTFYSVVNLFIFLEFIQGNVRWFKYWRNIFQWRLLKCLVGWIYQIKAIQQSFPKLKYARSSSRIL